ncbi:MAG: hypothetical protein WC251_01070 [Candidatus Izemoplasmatales bacterium]|jgi:hypothetical protein|nr:hypothetical protein [Candidatus Izemoplasmatales bacterium]
MAKDNLKEERMKILELLQKGSITADQAEKLLSSMGESEPESKSVSIQTKMPFRMLKIKVLSADGDIVNIQLPVEFAKLMKSKKFKLDKLEDVDIDVDSLIDMVNSGAIGELVDVKSADGDVVKIVVE